MPDDLNPHYNQKPDATVKSIITELYKTNLKFRTTQSGIIEILNQQFIPIATINVHTQ